MISDASEPKVGEVAIFLGDQYKSFCQDYDRLDEPDFNAKYNISWAQGHRPWIVGGGHTTGALKRCRDAQPDCEDWLDLPAHLIICKSMSDTKTLRYLRSKGDMLNKQVIQRRISYRELEEKMYMEGLSWADQDPTCGWLADMKQQWASRFGMAVPTIGTIWQTAKRRGTVRKLIEQIIQGDVAQPKTYKAPTSATGLKMAGGLDDSALEPMLAKVVSRQWNLNKLTYECEAWKTERFIRTQIIHALNLADWEEGRQKFPKICNRKFPGQWVNAFQIAKKDKVRKRLKKSGQFLGNPLIPDNFLPKLHALVKLQRRVRVCWVRIFGVLKRVVVI